MRTSQPSNAQPRYKKLLFTALLCWLPLTGSAMEIERSEPIDMLQALSLALENDPDWQSTQQQIAASQEIAPQSRALLLPNISVSANTNKTDQETSSYFYLADTKIEGDPVESEGNSYDYTLGISQPLFNLDAWFQYKASQATHSQLEQQLKSSYQAFIVDVANLYLNVLRADAQLKFTEAEQAATKQQLEQAQQRFKVGLIAITDVHEAQAAFDLAEVNRLAAATDLDISYENLSRRIGKNITQIKTLAENYPIENPAPNDMSHWVSLARANNPTILAAQFNQTASQETLNSAKYYYAPEVNLVGSFSETKSSLNSSDNESNVIGLSLTMPLFQGLGNASLHKQRRLELDAAKNDLKTAIQDTTLNTRNFFRSVQTDVLRVKARMQAIQSSSSALEATEAGYEVGTRNVVDVLNAQRTLFSSQRDYADSRYDYVIDSLQLEQAIGKISLDDIRELNRWLTQ